MYHVLLAFQCIYGCNDEGDENGEGRMGPMGVRFLKEGREWRLPGLLYADDLVLCGESKDDLIAMVVHFSEECRKRPVS